MRAVAQLFALYFTATPLMLGLAALGVVVMAAGLTSYLFIPTWSLGTGMNSSPLWYQALITTAPWLGLILLFSATTLLPSIVERFAFGRLILVLPGGRLRVLISAIAAAAAIALLTATAGELWFFQWPREFRPERVFSRILLVVFSTLSLTYLAVWIVGKTRGIWRLLGSLVVVLGIVLPIGLIGRPVGVPPFIWVGVAGWAVFAVLLLGGGRIRHALPRRAASLKQRLGRLIPGAAYAAGDELVLLLGTGSPAKVAVGQAVPIVAATWLIVEPGVWLLYLATFCAISGAVTSTAAARSRVLWLRFGWARPELFRHVEAAYWRYTAYPLGVLLVLFVAIGSYLEFATPVLALGVPLLVLGSVASSYLGLMMTRDLRWLDAMLGVATMALLLYTARTVGDADTAIDKAIWLETALAVAAVLYRSVAQARWGKLDWMECRRAAAARGAG